MIGNLYNASEFAKHATLIPVHVHVGDKFTKMTLGVLRVGYTLNGNESTARFTKSGWYDVYMADIELAWVGDFLYQVITDTSGDRHLHLPSTVSESRVWR